MRRFAPFVICLGLTIGAALPIGAGGCSEPAVAPAVRPVVDRTFAPTAGTSVAYQQTLTLSLDSVGGVPQNDLRVIQSVGVQAGERRADGAREMVVSVGRVRVWVGDLSGPPAIDTGNEGFAAAERVYESEEAELSTLLAALWASTSGTTSHAWVANDARVVEIRRDPVIAERLDGVAAEHLGTSLLEGVLSDPTHLFVPLAGSDLWHVDAVAALDLWDTVLTLDVAHAVTGSGAAGFSLALSATPLQDTGVGPLTVGYAGLVGSARVASDGVAERIDWTLQIDAQIPPTRDGGTVTRSTARLAHALRRADDIDE